MVEAQTLLDEALGAWAGIRQSLIAELENVPGDRFGYSVGEGGRTVGQIARHILESGLIFAGEVAREDGDFWRAPFSVLHQDYCAGLPPGEDRDELIDLLRTTMLQIDTTVRRAGAAHLFGSMRGIQGVTGTRLATLHFAISHEMYHTGQVALSARAMGLVPALTKRFQQA